MFIFIIIAIVAVAAIVYYIKKEKEKSTASSTGTTYEDIKGITNPVTPSMSNPTADPAKEVTPPSMGNLPN